MGIQLDRIVLRQIRMPLVHFFETSFGRTYDRDMVLVEVVADGVSGWGEVTAGENPFYNEEWTESAWLILRDYVAPRVLRYEFASAARRCRAERRTFAGTTWRAADSRPRCGISKRGGTVYPLWQQIGGGARQEISCGVSIGIQDSVDQLLARSRRN